MCFFFHFSMVCSFMARVHSNSLASNRWFFCTLIYFSEHIFRPVSIHIRMPILSGEKTTTEKSEEGKKTDHSCAVVCLHTFSKEEKFFYRQWYSLVALLFSVCCVNGAHIQSKCLLRGFTFFSYFFLSELFFLGFFLYSFKSTTSNNLIHLKEYQCMEINSHKGTCAEIDGFLFDREKERKGERTTNLLIESFQTLHITLDVFFVWIFSFLWFSDGAIFSL